MPVNRFDPLDSLCAYDASVHRVLTKDRTAKELEHEAALARPPRTVFADPSSEPMATLIRRGLRPTQSKPDLPFPRDFSTFAAERLSTKLGHYAFRLFLRGAILKAGSFRPADVTQYVTAAAAARFAGFLVELGLAREVEPGSYCLTHPGRSFGGVLEWYVARELHRRLGFLVASGLKCRAPGVGGDLDVVAAAEGKLVYLELKSSPPKHLKNSEIGAFFTRLDAVRPDVALFVLDTALRLEDKVVPMLLKELAKRRRARALPKAQRVVRELWALAPHLYAVNAKTDLIANIGRAIAEGFRALAPTL